jgi:hypothetical protein
MRLRFLVYDNNGSSSGDKYDRQLNG